MRGPFDDSEAELYGWCDGCEAEYVLGSDDHDGERGLCFRCAELDDNA